MIEISWPSARTPEFALLCGPPGCVFETRVYSFDELAAKRVAPLPAERFVGAPDPSTATCLLAPTEGCLAAAQFVVGGLLPVRLLDLASGTSRTISDPIGDESASAHLRLSLSAVDAITQLGLSKPTDGRRRERFDQLRRLQAAPLRFRTDSVTSLETETARLAIVVAVRASQGGTTDDALADAVLRELVCPAEVADWAASAVRLSAGAPVEDVRLATVRLHGWGFPHLKESSDPVSPGRYHGTIDKRSGYWFAGDWYSTPSCPNPPAADDVPWNPVSDRPRDLSSFRRIVARAATSDLEQLIGREELPPEIRMSRSFAYARRRALRDLSPPPVWFARDELGLSHVRWEWPSSSIADVMAISGDDGGTQIIDRGVGDTWGSATVADASSLTCRFGISRPSGSYLFSQHVLPISLSNPSSSTREPERPTKGSDHEAPRQTPHVVAGQAPTGPGCARRTAGSAPPRHRSLVFAALALGLVLVLVAALITVAR